MSVRPGQFREVRIRFEPRGASATLFERRDSQLIVSGPAGTGKSRACLEKLHLCALKYPGMRALMLRKRRTDLTGSAMVTFEGKVLAPADGVRYVGAGGNHPGQYKYPNGSVIGTAGLDKDTKILSFEFDIIYVQQAEELIEAEWETLTTRLRYGVLPYQQLMGDCNPSAPGHWIKRRADTGRTAMLESRHEDNPVIWDVRARDWTDTGRDYIAKLDALTGVRLLRLRKGLWAAAEGVCYEGWDPALHMLERLPIPADWPRYWSIDFGFTNPTCCQWWAVDPDGRLYRYRELYMSHRLYEDHARQMLAVSKDEPKPRAIVCDHDAEGRATLERHLHMATTAAQKAIKVGIDTVAARLKCAGDGQPRLFLMRDALVERDPLLEEAKLPTCTEEEVESYVWDRTASGGVKEVPVDKDNHGCLAAGTIIETSTRPLRIEQIEAGMLVLTRAGYQAVLAAGQTSGHAEVARVLFSDGRVLTGTANHPVWTEGRGFVRLDDLRYADIIGTCDPWPWSSAVSSFGDIQMLSGGQTASTTSRMSPSAKKASGGFMRKSGKPFTAQYRLDAISIMATVMRFVTIQTIWSALRRPSTSHGISNTRGQNQQQPWRGLLNSVRRLRLGIGQKRAAPGIASMAGRFGMAANIGQSPVSGAAQPSKHEPSVIVNSFARTHARRPGASPVGRMTNSERAPFAGGCSSSTDTPRPDAARVYVVAVVALEKRRPVYNLAVEGAHEYFANGVLVHNCDSMRYMVMHLDGPGNRGAGWLEYARRETVRLNEEATARLPSP